MNSDHLDPINPISPPPPIAGGPPATATQPTTVNRAPLETDVIDVVQYKAEDIPKEARGSAALAAISSMVDLGLVNPPYRRTSPTPCSASSCSLLSASATSPPTGIATGMSSTIPMGRLSTSATETVSTPRVRATRPPIPSSPTTLRASRLDQLRIASTGARRMGPALSAAQASLARFSVWI